MANFLPITDLSNNNFLIDLENISYIEFWTNERNKKIIATIYMKNTQNTVNIHVKSRDSFLEILETLVPVLYIRDLNTI